jgi:hypothetical protein
MSTVEQTMILEKMSFGVNIPAVTEEAEMSSKETVVRITPEEGNLKWN